MNGRIKPKSFIDSTHIYLLTVEEVCKILRIHRSKVYDLLKDKTLDGVKVGRDWKVKADSVEAITGPLKKLNGD